MLCIVLFYKFKVTTSKKKKCKEDSKIDVEDKLCQRRTSKKTLEKKTVKNREVELFCWKNKMPYELGRTSIMRFRKDCKRRQNPSSRFRGAQLEAVYFSGFIL